MPTTYLYLKVAHYAKLVYVQEQMNKGKPLEEQKKISQIMREWIEERLEGCDIPAHLEEKHVLDEEG